MGKQEKLFGAVIKYGMVAVIFALIMTVARPPENNFLTTVVYSGLALAGALLMLYLYDRSKPRTVVEK
jgi:hypothetical protein